MKTGVYIYPISEPIVERIMKKYKFKGVTPTLNFIIQQYDKLVREQKLEDKEIDVEKELKTREPKPEKPKIDFSEWFLTD